MTLMVFGPGVRPHPSGKDKSGSGKDKFKASEPPKLNPQLEAILDPQLRVDVAHKVNEAILKANGEVGEARLDELIRTRVWAEQKARAMGKAIPPEGQMGIGLTGAIGKRNAGPVEDEDKMAE